MHRYCIFLLIHVVIIYADLTSYINLNDAATDFIPQNSVELRAVYPSVRSRILCAAFCNQDPQCRTFVYSNGSLCRLYESSSNSGSIINSPIVNCVVGVIDYSRINLASSYNQSCDRCYPDRYLVCRNNTCQCPLNTYWDGQSMCRNQLYVGSPLTCQNNNWCREDLNLTCQCGKCQCPVQTFWNNQTCVPQYLSGMSCNTSNQCRNDLNLTCSRTNKTCTTMNLIRIPVINGTIPAKFANLGILLNYTGMQWWKAFDNITTSCWNAIAGYALNYLLITFNDTYLLNALQMTVYGDYWHDTKTLDIYLDENATCIQQSFSYPVINGTYFYTFSRNYFNNIYKPVMAKQILIAVDRWSINQLYLCELAFYGRLA